MTSPRTLLLAIAATLCGFALVLVVVISQASLASTAPSTDSIVAQEVSHVAPVVVTVAWEPAASRSAALQAHGR